MACLRRRRERDGRSRRVSRRAKHDLLLIARQALFVTGAQPLGVAAQLDAPFVSDFRRNAILHLMPLNLSHPVPLRGR